jgi:hypothetical protein
MYVISALRGVTMVVEVEWDIAAVPSDGGLPASEAIVEPGLGCTRIEAEERMQLRRP